jgi:hypothetical protein
MIGNFQNLLEKEEYLLLKPVILTKNSVIQKDRKK